MLPTSLPPNNEFGRSTTVLSNGTNLNGDFGDQELLQEAIPETINSRDTKGANSPIYSSVHYMVTAVLMTQSSNMAMSAMRGTNSRNYLDMRANGCHQSQLNSLNMMVIDENASINDNSPRNSDGKFVPTQRKNTILGNMNNTKTKDSKYNVPRRKFTQSLDLSANFSSVVQSSHMKDHNHRYHGNMGRGVDESKTHRDRKRWSHDHNNYPYHANQRSEFSFELNEYDEDICKRTATRAYSTQISLECDMEVAQCVHVTAVAHDRALFEHAQCVHIHVANAKQIAISEWLQSKSKEEQIQYLNHHKPRNISVPGKP